MLILHETYDHWSVAVLTVNEHFIYSHFWFFFQIGCFLHWIQSVYPHLFCSLYDNGSPLYLRFSDVPSAGHSKVLEYFLLIFEWTNRELSSLKSHLKLITAVFDDLLCNWILFYFGLSGGGGGGFFSNSLVLGWEFFNKTKWYLMIIALQL